jgi:hypothetical protein
LSEELQCPEETDLHRSINLKVKVDACVWFSPEITTTSPQTQHFPPLMFTALVTCWSNRSYFNFFVHILYLVLYIRKNLVFRFTGPEGVKKKN